MTLPPSFLRLNDGRHCFWIPIFLLWPLLFLLWVLVGLSAAVALLIFSPGGFPLIFEFCGGLARLFWELRGTEVAVETNGTGFDLTVY